MRRAPTPPKPVRVTDHAVDRCEEHHKLGLSAAELEVLARECIDGKHVLTQRHHHVDDRNIYMAMHGEKRLGLVIDVKTRVLVTVLPSTHFTAGSLRKRGKVPPPSRQPRRAPKARRKRGIF